MHTKQPGKCPECWRPMTKRDGHFRYCLDCRLKRAEADRERYWRNRPARAPKLDRA